ncbi:hypothetical protein CANARDRAFT_22252 [[Candida] arabinofermentans NRRL YB-2248]|uniref:Mediator of RNA polymerase II transcription subunit 22 n=1 Tax=[Candida] arabinofermentans NRRL YB-2248 TaxID=983967 RepID=A0A1E4T3M1_9ASCO|nr:hypothetical protein CANARDRAFT_22252 [[Candida] arabinofermentans NRRL YB-2248]
MQKSSLTLITKIDNNVELMLQKFHDIIELSSVLDKSQETLAIESLQIESNTSTIIRLAEELLSITRMLKESWILGQVPTISGHEGETTEAKDEQDLELYFKVNQLLDNVAGLQERSSK